MHVNEPLTSIFPKTASEASFEFANLDAQIPFVISLFTAGREHMQHHPTPHPINVLRHVTFAL